MVWRPLLVARADEAAARRLQQKTRFLLDEDVDRVIADGLRTEGYNIRTAQQSGLVGRADEEVLAAAHRDNRVLLTHDGGFKNEGRFPPHRNPGIVILPGGSGDFSALARAFRVVTTLIGPYREIWRGATITVGANGEIAVRQYEHDLSRRTVSRYSMPKNGPALIWDDGPGHGGAEPVQRPGHT